MQIEIKTQALSQSLFFLSNALVNNPEFPVLNYIHFSCEPANRRIVLTTSNIETSVISECPAIFVNSNVATSFLVPAKQFINLISNSSADKTLLKFSEDSYSLRYNLGQTSGKLKCLNADDFPKPLFGQAPAIQIKAHDLWDMITKTIIACDSSDTTRLVLTGIHLTVDQNIFQMVSGDGYRLALFRQKLVDSYIPAEGIIPSKYLKPLRSMLRQMDDDDLVSIRILANQNNKIVFELGSAVYITQVLADTFPNVSGIFSMVYDKALEISTPALGEAIGMHTSYTNDSAGTTYFKSNSNAQYCMVSTSENNGAVGTVVADLDGTIQFPDICFNIKFLADFIKVCSDKQIFIYLNSESSPIFLRPASSVQLDTNNEMLGYSYYIMPISDSIKISEQEYDYQAIDKIAEVIQSPNPIANMPLNEIEVDLEKPVTRFVEGITNVVNEDYPF